VRIEFTKTDLAGFLLWGTLWGTYKWDLSWVRVIGFVGMARWTPFWFHRFDQKLEANQTVEATLQREEPS
jgi:hypothetical protein